MNWFDHAGGLYSPHPLAVSRELAVSGAICLELLVRLTHHYLYHYSTTPTPASASQLLPHTSLIAVWPDQLSGNAACTALLWRSVQGYRWDSCEPQGALMATNLAPLLTH